MNKYLIARLNLGLTKARVSRDTGIAEWTIKRIEEGKKVRKSTLDLIEKYYREASNGTI